MKDKVAVITGSGRGIGRGIALALATQGCHVAVNYVHRRSEAEATAEAARALGVKAVVIRANVSKESEARGLVEEAASQLGGLDIFIGNAASGVLKPIIELTTREWDWTMNTNARGLLAGVQAATPFMRAAGWGRVVTVSSIGSRRVVPNYGMVGASKATLEALTRYLAVELAPDNIIVNCVSPGLVLTGALDAFPHQAEMIAQAHRNTPVGRLATPEDVGQVVAWLCSDAAAMIVGQTLEVDGGYSLGAL